MGLFYTNMTVYRPLRRSLLGVLRQLGRTAFVGPTIDGHTVVFDRAIDEQGAPAIGLLGRSLTKALSCSALAALLEDDDVLYLWLFCRGRLRDSYNSCPGYYDDRFAEEPPTGGNAKLICKAFDRLDRQQRVEQLLRADLLKEELPEVRGEQGRHAAVAAELGMPAFVAGVCYSSVAGDYVPREFILREFEGMRFEAV